MTLYNIFSEATGYRVAKWSEPWELEASYLVTNVTCDCPARVKPCKHVSLVAQALAQGKIDKQEFFCAETASWHYMIPKDQTFTPIKWRRM